MASFYLNILCETFSVDAPLAFVGESIWQCPIPNLSLYKCIISTARSVRHCLEMRRTCSKAKFSNYCYHFLEPLSCVFFKSSAGGNPDFSRILTCSFRENKEITGYRMREIPAKRIRFSKHKKHVCTNIMPSVNKNPMTRRRKTA